MKRLLLIEVEVGDAKPEKCGACDLRYDLSSPGITVPACAWGKTTVILDPPDERHADCIAAESALRETREVDWAKGFVHGYDGGDYDDNPHREEP